MSVGIYIINKLKDFQKPFYLRVSGDSMAPKINSGDRILVEPYNYIKKTLSVGDVIVYHKFLDHLTVHRIINIVLLNELGFYCETKGDNNIKPDSYKVFSHEIIGTVDLRKGEKNGFN